jgi:hypothetical protein
LRRFDPRKLVTGLAAAAVLMAQTVAWAAPEAQLSGRVYERANGAGVANAAVYLCGENGFAYTDSEGKWTAKLASGMGYCARVVGGTPAGEVAVAVNANPDVGTPDSYEYQYAGKNCYHSSGCSALASKWDRAQDSGLDFAFAAAASIAGAPGAAPTAVSADKVATAQMPGLGDGVSCGVVPSGKQLSSGWGPYALACKDAQGSAAKAGVTVRWAIKVGRDGETYKNLSAVTIDQSGHQSAIKGAAYDKKAGLVTFEAPGEAMVGVKGTTLRAPVFYLVVAGVALLIALFTSVVWWRGRKAQT